MDETLDPDTGAPSIDPDATEPPPPVAADTPPADTAEADADEAEPDAALDPDADDGDGEDDDDGVTDRAKDTGNDAEGCDESDSGTDTDADPDAEADTDEDADADPDTDAGDSGEAVDSDAAGDDAESSTESGGEAGDAGAFDLPLESVVEAILFSTNKPLKLDQIAKFAGTRIRRERVAEAIALLNRVYEETGRSFEIVEVAETFQMMSRPEYAPTLHALHGKPPQAEGKKYTPAALDTLSIIAYKQPITRADVEAIRGVGCGPIMRQLMERGMIRVVGKKTDIIGHPLLYGTTPDFLKEFGLGTLESLPMIHEFRRMTGSADPLPSEAQPHVQLTLVDRIDAPEEIDADADGSTDPEDEADGDPAGESDAEDSSASESALEDDIDSVQDSVEGEGAGDSADRDGGE